MINNYTNHFQELVKYDYVYQIQKIFERNLNKFFKIDFNYFYAKCKLISIFRAENDDKITILKFSFQNKEFLLLENIKNDEIHIEFLTFLG